MRARIRLCRAEPPGLPAGGSAAVATGFALVAAVWWCEGGYRSDLKDFCLMITIRGNRAVFASRLSRHLRLASNKLGTDYWNITIMREISRKYPMIGTEVVGDGDGGRCGGRRRRRQMWWATATAADVVGDGHVRRM
jgi:hypothetical protein